MEFLTYLLKSAGILCLFYLVYAFFLKRETLFTANRHFLLSGIITAFTLPVIEWTKITYVKASPVEMSEEIIPLTQSGPVTQAGATLPWTDILLYIYLTGVLILAVRFLFHLWNLQKLISASSRFSRDGFTYVKVDAPVKPFSFFKLIVFNPDMHEASELQMVLAHEQAHVRQLHSLDLLVANLLMIVQWWNPLTWIYRRCLEENLEFLADNETAQRVESVKQYQLALVRASSSSFSPLLINSFYQSFIKKRILMLNKPHSKQHNFLKAMLILPALALFLWSFNVKEEIQLIPSEPVTVDKEYPPAQAGINTSIPEAVTLATSEEDQDPKIAQTIPSSPAIASVQTMASTASLAVTPSSMPVKAQIASTVKPTLAKVIVRITKNTSKAELEEKKMYLAEQGIELDYSKLKYNDNGELTGISVSISSKNGNSNYDISGDDPISDIIINIGDNGISMGTSGASYARAMELQKRYQERAAAAEARGYARAQERDAMMAERELEMRERMADREEELARRFEDQQRAKMAMAESRALAQAKGQSYAIAGYSSRGGVTIDKDTTDEELAKYKQELARHGVEFDYKRVKRNDAGEITSLKYTVKKNGEESQTSIKSNGKPIKRTRIGY